MSLASNPHPRHVQEPTTPCGRLLTLHTLGLGLVSILAFLAVVLLAGQRGKPAPTTPAFLAKTLGPSASARPAGRPAPGVAVRFDRSGLAVSRSGSTLRLGVVGPAASPWAGFVNGASRRTSFGLETVTYDPGKVEQFLTVTERQGPKTWRWRLSGPAPRLRADGSVTLGRGGLAIAPAAVLDVRGHAVTPTGIGWSLRKQAGGWTLELALDDAGLSLPYVIDPAITWRASSSANNAGGALNLTINKPAGAVQNDLLLAHLSVRGGAAATLNAPAGWTLVRRTDNATAPGLAQAFYTKVAGSGEPASYQWTFDSSRRAAGGITSYFGVDNSNIVDVWSENTGSGNKNAQANSITTTGANHRVVGIYGSSASTSFTPAAGMTERYDTNSTGATAEAADTTQVAAGATGNKTSVAVNNGTWVAQLVALRLDAVNPTAPAPTISESTADSHAIGSAFYYRPGGAGGSFTVTDAATDGGSGLTKVTFPGMAVGAGITPTSSLDVLFPGPYSRAYTWATGASDSGSKTVTAVDNAGNSASTTFTVTPDSGAPTGQTISLPGGPYFNALSVPYTTGDGTDALSGLDTTTRLVERATATLAADGCGTFGSFAPAPASPDTTVAAGNCYRYRFTIKDNVGNVSAAVTADAKVDTGNPSVAVAAPVEVGNPGAQYYDSASKTHYFRPAASGSFTLTATASDTVTAVAQVGFPDLSSVSGWSGSTGGSDTAAPYASPVDYSWTAGASAPGARNVTATDKAGNSASDTVTISTDSSAPSGQTITLTGAGAPWYTAAPVTFSLADGTDSGSGVDVASRTVTRETGTLSGGSCSGFSADAGTYTSPDSAVSGGHCYRYTFVESDRVGNQSTGVSVTAKVDTTAPDTPALSFGSFTNASATGSTVYFRTGAAGGFTATAVTADAESAIDHVSFPALGSGWSGGGNDSSAPYSSAYTFSAGAAEPGSGQSTAAVDGAGLTASSSFTVTADGGGPTVSLDDPGAVLAGTVGLSAAANDSGSGLDTVEFQWSVAGADSWTTLPGSSWDTTAVADGAYDLRARATDRVGNVSTSAALTRQVDNTGPIVSITAPADGSFVNASAADPSTVTADASDATGGIDSVEFFECSNMSTGCSSGTWSSLGVDSSEPYSASWTLPADGHRALKAEALDFAGHRTSHVVDVEVDRTAPTAVMDDPGANVRGTVSLSSTTGDSGSGLASATYAYKPSGGGSWTGTPAAWDTLVLADGLYDLRVTALDNAGNQTVSPAVTTRVDNTDPFTSDDAPAGYRSTPVTVTLTPADSGSGLADTEYSVDGAPYQSGTSVVIPAPGDHSNDGTHTIHYRSTDVAGNLEALRTATVRIDTTPPGGGSGDPGLYLRGTVALSATPSDAGAGIDSVVFQRSPAGLGSWTTIATDFSDPYGAGWDTTAVADGSYDLRFLFRDGATNESISTLTDRVVDNTVPSGILTAPADASFVAGLLGITADASDATSGVAQVEFQVKASGAADFTTVDTDSTVPYSTSWDSTVAPDGPADLRVVVTDLAGNSAPSATRTVTVDNEAPVVTLGDPGANVRGTVALTASSSADTAQVVFQRRPAGGGVWTTVGTDLAAPYSVDFDTTAVADGSYDLRAVATDLSLNQGTSALRTTLVDNTDPAGSLDAPANGATVGGPTVSLAATASDGGSGVSSVLFQYRLPAGPWIDISSDSSPPYEASWDTTSLADGPYKLHVVVTDAAGNSQTPPQVPVTVDSTPPTVTLDDPGSTISDVVSLGATVSPDTTSVVFQRRSAGGGTWADIATDSTAPFGASLDTTALPDGLYDLRAVASDSLGNTSSDTRPNVKVDNTAPVLLSSAPADGGVVSSADSVSLTADETLASVSAAALDGAPLTPPSLSGATADFDTGDLDEGPHTVWATLHDLAGQTTVVLVHFTVWSAGAGDFPYVEKNDPVAVGTTLVAVGGGGRVTVPADATILSGGDWLVLRVDPSPAAGAAGGFEGAGDTFDVSLRWALGGGNVHQFDHPLLITIPAGSGAILPATYESGAWRLLRRVPTAGSLPAGWSDGYYLEGSEVKILTLHLSRFGLLRDVEAPALPGGFAGTVSAGALTLSWAPGADNSGLVDHFSVYVDGSLHGTYDSAARSAGLGPFTSADARAFSISESDAAGNESGRTSRLRAVPELAGLTEAEARAALEAHGFHAGSVQHASSATVAAGRVLAGAGTVRLAEEGTTVDFTVSAGSASLPFDFKVLAPARFSWARARSITVRFSVSQAAAVTGRLVSPRGKTLRTWRISVKAGSSSSLLKMPASARKSGRYRIRWAAKAARETLSRTTYLRVSGTVRRKSGHAAAVPLRRPDPPAGAPARAHETLATLPNGAHLRFRNERAGVPDAAPVLPGGGGAGDAISADSRAPGGVLALLVALALTLLLGAFALSVRAAEPPRLGW